MHYGLKIRIEPSRTCSFIHLIQPTGFCVVLFLLFGIFLSCQGPVGSSKPEDTDNKTFTFKAGGVDISNSEILQAVYLEADAAYPNGGISLDLSGCFGSSIDYADVSANIKSRFVSVILPDSVLDINDASMNETGAFKGFASLKNISGAKVTSVGWLAFSGCTSLETAEFPELLQIGGGAFGNCLSLTAADFPKMEAIGSSAFYNCSSLTSVNFPQLTRISQYVFRGCTSLVSGGFPKATIIFDHAFIECIVFENLTLGPSYYSVFNDIFNGISGNTITINVPSANMANYSSWAGTAFFGPDVTIVIAGY